MKKIFIIAGMMVAGATYAQDSSNNYKGNVGVNTTTPGATLDVNISKASGIKAELGQGIAFPRVSVSTLNAMTGDIVTSSMVYVTDVAGGSTIARTADVDAVGYYFFNGTKWTKLGGGAASTGANLYTENGTLDEERTVTQDNKNLTFVTGGTGRMIIDGTSETKGAVYGKVRVVTSLTNFKINDDDYIVVVNVSGAQNIPLPDPKSYSGRIIHFRNGSASTGTSGTYTFTGFAPVNNTTLLASRAATIASDGTNWYFVSGV